MYKIGVDLGGTNISLGVVDDNWAIIGRGRRKTLAGRPAQEIMADIVAAAMDAIEAAKLKLEDIESVGLATPGSVEKDTGVITFANNLDFHNVPARELLSQWFSCPIYLDNDANCAALGEAIAGCGKGVGSFVAITLGTGVGSGIVIDGKIVNGVNDAAGECGHMVIDINGKPCNCGRRGCWEAYASATALMNQARDAGLNIENAKDVFDARDAGNERAALVVEQYLRYLAIGLGNLINALQPDKICIGGGLAYQGENLLAPLCELVKHERYTRYAPKQTELVRAVLGNDAGIVGAAALTK